MVLLLIDDSILDNDEVNSNYFTDHNIIPLNSDIGIMKLPYYYNSKHYYRDLSLKDLSDIETISQKRLKPVNYAKYTSQSFYNPKQNKGKIESYEYIPTKMRKYNITPENIIINRIVIWTKRSYISVNPYLEIFNTISTLNSEKINFVTYSICDKIYFNEYILIPKDKSKISIYENTFLDLSKIIPLKIKDIKFVIECIIL